MWAGANWGWELGTSARQFARFSLSTLVGAGVRELAGRGGREVVRKGRAGEIAAGIERQQRERTSGAYITTKSKTRIPDLIIRGDKVLVEVKNVEQLSMTRQLREYLMWAEENGYTLELRTRKDTRLSSELEQLIQSGKIKHNPCIR